MSRSGLPRWAAVAVLPLLAGAVLLMHGLEPRAGTPAASGTAVEHQHDNGTDHRRSCDSCPGPHHLLAACVAVVATIGACTTARRLTTTIRAAAPAAPGLAGRARALLAEVAPPPDPAWVRLSVMRC